MASKIHPDSIRYIPGYKITAREFLNTDSGDKFRTLCRMKDIEPTKRQARDFMAKRGRWTN